MENENLTPTPEQPAQKPEQQPVQPQPYQQPQYQPPQYQPQPVQQPQYPQYLQYPPYAQQPQYPPQYPQYAQQQYPQQPQQPKKKTAAWKIVVPIVAGVLVLAILAGVYFLFLRPTPIQKIALSETELYLKPEDGYELYFTFEPADASGFAYTWTSSDPNVATVENGGVTAVGEGECTITLHAGDGLEASCKVTVEAPAPDGADIVGTWRFDGAYFDDVYYDVGEMDAKLYVYADNTAVVVIDGQATALTWEYSDSDESMDYYDVLDEAGTVCQFQYYADPSDEYYGDLTLYGDWENMIFFTR